MSYGYDIPARINTEGRTGKTIFLLGSASIGPTFDLIPLTDIDQVSNMFGAEGTIPEAYKMAASTELDCDIFAMKVTGAHSVLPFSLNVYQGDIIEEGLILTSTHASEISNDIKVEVSADTLIIHYPAEFGGHTITYNFDDYKVMCFLIRAINKDAEDGIGYVRAYSPANNDTQLYGSLIGINPSIQNMYGGESGLDWGKAELYNQLNIAYQIIESLNVDVVVPLNAFMDDVHPRYIYGVDYYSDIVTYTDDREYLDYKVNGTSTTFHRQLIDFCKKQMNMGIKTHGVMGMNPLKDLESFSNPENRMVENLIKASPLGKRLGFNELDPEDPNSDDGMFISIVLGDLKLPDKSIYNGYIAYAMQYASQIRNLSTTNQPLNDTIEIVHEFTTEELDYLSRKGIVAYRVSPLKGLVVHNGVSAANPKSEYHLSCNVRMVQLILSKIRKTLDKYIGEPVHILKENGTIEDEVSNIFEDAVNSNIVKEHSYSINYSKDGNITIPVKLKTQYMINGVEASV